MTDIVLVLDGAEAAVVDAALAEYRGALLRADAKGGVAAEMAQTMGPVANRVARALHLQMYGLDEADEPTWLHEAEGADPVTFAKGEAERMGEYPPEMTYHDWQAAS